MFSTSCRNEVPILFVFGLVSVRLRDGGWSAIGFRRPESWLRLVLIALAAAVLRIVLGDFVIEPLAAHWWPPIHPPAGTEHIAGNIKMALLWLLIIWTFAAFGEEISYRGYLTRRTADVGGRSPADIRRATRKVTAIRNLFAERGESPDNQQPEQCHLNITGNMFGTGGRVNRRPPMCSQRFDHKITQDDSEHRCGQGDQDKTKPRCRPPESDRRPSAIAEADRNETKHN